MSPSDRLVELITRQSRLVIAVLLVFTVVIGSGVTAIDDDSSLDQFETESEEAEKLEYVEENFGVEENTTTAQILIRDDNVLDKQSLIATLELRQELRNNETVNETLAGEGVSDLSMIVARSAMIEERQEELDARSEQLENESEQLEAEFERLENESEQLENESQRLENESEQLENESQRLEEEFEQLEEDAQELERRQQQLEEDAAQLEEDRQQLEEDRQQLEERQRQLEQDQQELEERAAFMSGTLDRVRDVQTEYDEGNIDEEERDNRINALENEAADELSDEQYAEFEPLIEDARVTQAEMNAVQAQYEAGEIDEEEYQDRMAELEGEMEGIYGAIEGQVLAEEFAELQERGEELESEAQDLEERGEQLEERGEELEERRDQLQEDAEELEERREALEARANELEERGEELEERGEELQERGEELEERGEELEERADELEERGERLQEEYEQLGEIDPTTEEAIEQLESMSESEIEDQVASTLDEDADDGVFVFLPTDYEPGSTQADARMLFVTQETPEASNVEGEAPRSIEESQLAMASIVDDRFDDGLVFGSGIISDEMDRSLSDSLAIVLPLALLFVSIVLAIAYRDLLDILIGLLGVVLVLIWTVGFMGWTGIAFNVVMVAVPVLLVGLSIDYAIHVFMRHREHRSADRESTRRAMAVALSGVGLALIWVTATAMIGFLSNLISPVGPIREFGVTSAFGIATALLIFGVLVPALKLETDAILEQWGFDRRKRAFGTGGGAFSSFLSLGSRAAGRIPWAVVFVALLLTAGGVIGATQVDTSFEQEEFLADDPPEWTKTLPEPFAPGTYTAKENLEYVNEHFLRQDSQAQILIEGNVTDDRTLERINSTEREAAEKDTVMVLSSGDADVDGPLSTMERVADRNESFNETFTEADTTGDGVPDEDVEEVYDALFEADEDAAGSVIHRTDDGEYEAVRMVISVDGSASAEAVTEDMRAVAASIDGDGLEATATGQVIVFHVIENELFATVIESLLLTLIAVFAFLMVGYRWLHGSALLGAITLLPIVFAVAWILGTMYLLEIPFNVMTGTITSLTVGLGVAYNIHMSERYMLERRRGRSVLDALYVAVTGTGGALLGSAATTIGGFGVLVFAILPPLEQFGLISGLTILYAFLGSVFVLPSFLVLWSRYLGPPGASTAPDSDERKPAVESGAGDTPGGTD